MNQALDLYEKTKHGDQEHQDWLKEACVNFFEGKEVPAPRGSDTKDRLYKEIQRLTAENKELEEKVCSLQKIIDKQ